MNEGDYKLKDKDEELIDMVRNYIKNKELDELRQITEHKCFGCVWGKWCGSKYKCMYPRCFKTLRHIENKKK